MSIASIIGRALPDSDHVARYVPLSKLRNDGIPDTEAFKIHPKDQGYLSVDWLEYYDTEDENSNRIESLIKAMSKAINPNGRLNLTKYNQGKFAIFNVGNIKHAIHEASSIEADEVNVCQIKNRQGHTDSHTGIFYPENLDEIAEAVQKSILDIKAVADNFPKQ